MAEAKTPLLRILQALLGCLCPLELEQGSSKIHCVGRIERELGQFRGYTKLGGANYFPKKIDASSV